MSGAELLLILCVFLSAFFSSSESAFLSLQRTRIAHLVSEGLPGAQRVAHMMDQPERLLATILLGNNLVNVAFTALLTVVAVSAFGDGAGIAVATGLGTVVLLIFGEVIPKTIAVRNAERVAFLYASPLTFVEYLMLPIVIMLHWLTRRINGLVGGDASVGIAVSITEAEFRSLVDIGEVEGTFQAAEADLLDNVFRFGDLRVVEIMTPRNEIIAIERNATLQQLLGIFQQEPHSRFPVYGGNYDDIQGLVSIKDVVGAMASKGRDYVGPVSQIMRQVEFVPETKLIAEIFDNLKESGNQMAIVVDEHGGIAGLVTLKQFLEQLSGAVGEEGESPRRVYEVLDEETFRVDGAMSVDQVNEKLGMKIPDGEYDTIAGFALDVLGHIPEVGERFVHEDISIEVTEMEGLRITGVNIIKVTDEDSPPKQE